MKENGISCPGLSGAGADLYGGTLHMKRKWKIAAAVLCVCLLLTVAYAATSGAGTQNDPLVTLSYLTNIFAPKVKELADQTVEEYQAENRDELEGMIDGWDEEVRQAIDEAEVSGSSGATYQTVTLEGDQVLVLGEGCEVILRSGTAKWTAESLLMDTTSGKGLASGKKLEMNHLYVGLAEGYITAVSTQSTTTTQPAQATGTVTAGPLNIRSGPSSSNNIVGSLNEGDVVVILDTVDGWHRVTSGGVTGYISADYVEVYEAEPTPSVEPAAATATFMVRGSYTVE